MNRQQDTLMSFDPASGEARPYPSHAQQWRDFHGKDAWLFNPWSGERRKAGDIGSDPFGILIVPPGEPIYSARGEKLFNWTPAFSIGFPHSHLLQMVEIHHPNGDVQTLYDQRCEKGRWFSTPVEFRSTAGVKGLDDAQP